MCVQDYIQIFVKPVRLSAEKQFVLNGREVVLDRDRCMGCMVCVAECLEAFYRKTTFFFMSKAGLDWHQTEDSYASRAYA